MDLSGKKILIISPHPDDELIGCYEILELYNNNVDVYYTGLTGRNLSEENRRIRTKEFIKLCNICRVNCILSTENWRKELEEMLTKKIYDCVFIPSYIDWHWEHRDVCMETLTLIQKSQYNTEIFLFCVTVQMPIQIVNFYAEKTPNKWNLFYKVYKSQRYMPIDRFKTVERRYVINGVSFEPYFRINNSDMTHVIDYFCSLNVDCLNDMEKQINDLERIHESSLPLYIKLQIANSETNTNVR